MMILAFLLSLAVIQKPADGVYVMSIDLGTEFMKVAVVAPGMPMDVALGSDSKRKSSTAISFNDGERLFGSASLTLANRLPHLVFQSVPAILGKRLDHPTVRLYQERYPYHNISYNETNDQLTFHHPDGMDFTVQELVAMLLEYAQGIAEHHSGHTIRSCVITVPNFFGQTERRNLHDAANLAGLTLLQLINANTAVALNFGVFRRTEFNTTARHYMFFDVGSMSTTALITSFAVGKNRESGPVSEDPILNVVGVGFNPTLGTSTLIYTLRDYLAERFNEKKKLSNDDVRLNVRSMSLLTTEAGRVFKVLSANTDAIVQVENLFKEEDFQFHVARTELEEMCAEHFKLLEGPFVDALQSSKLDISDIEEVVVMGGGTRVPKVQEVLMKLAKRTELGKGVNSDEAAVLGAAYRAAFHSPGLRVLPFAIRDYNFYPIGVDFARVSSSEVTDSTEETVRRVLFPRGNPFPQKRAITFNRHVNDLTFHVNYVDLSPFDKLYLGTQNLSSIRTLGVQEVIARYPQAEMRGVKAHFNLDYSGILTLTSVDCVFHPLPTEPTEPMEPVENQSTLQKLGSKISDFFGVNSGSTAEEGQNKPNNTDNILNGIDTKLPANGSTAQENSTDHNSTTSKLVTPAPPSPSTNESDASDVERKKNATKPPPAFSETVQFALTYLDASEPSKEHVRESVSKLNWLRQVKLDRENLEQAMNDLESALFNSREQLESEEFIKYSTDEERSVLASLVSQTLNWYDEQDRSTTKEAYVDKLSELRLHLIPIESRLLETKQRAPILAAIHQQLTYADQFLPQLQSIIKVFQELEATALLNQTETVDHVTTNDTEASMNTSDSSDSSPPSKSATKFKPPSNPWFSRSDVDSLEELVHDTKAWLSRTEATLLNVSPTERPPILVSEIQTKYDKLSRDLTHLSRRMELLRSELERHTRSQQTSSPPDAGNDKRESTDDRPSQSSAVQQESAAASGSDDGSATVEKTTPRSDL